VVGLVEAVRLPAEGELVGVKAYDDADAWREGRIVSWVDPRHSTARLGGSEPSATAGLNRTPQDVAEARIRLSESYAAALDGKRVWVRASDPAGTQQWFHGQGRPDGDLVIISRPVVAAVETRRAAIRAPLPGHATFTSETRHGRSTGPLVEISSTGCRVVLVGSALPTEGLDVDLTAALESGVVVRARCSVVRVSDGPPSEIGLRFEDLPRADGLRLEHEVLTRVVSPTEPSTS
jgi:hypothetical protein